MDKIFTFRWWCHKVLPLVYDDSLSYYELLCKVVKQLNETGELANELVDKFTELKEYVDSRLEEFEGSIEPMLEEKLDAIIAEWQEDGTIDDIIRRSALNNDVMLQSQYAGDIIISDSYHCSAAVVISELALAYILCAPTKAYAEANSTDNGILYVADLQTNQIATSYEIKCGHGNSMCYDPDFQRLYIAPVYSYTSGTQTSVRKLYSYPLSSTTGIVDTTGLVEISIPDTSDSTMFGVTFNSTDDINYRGLYCINYSYQPYRIRGYDTSIFFSEWGRRLDLNQTTDFSSDAEQGFAFYDKRFYITSARGKVFIYNVVQATGSTLNRITTKFLADSEIVGYRALGEHQDIEFSSNGDLFGASSLRISDGVTDAYLVRILYNGIPKDTNAYKIPMTTMYNMTSNSFYLSDSTIRQFRNANANLKHPAQLNFWADRYSVTQLIVNTNQYFDKLVFYEPVCIVLAADNATFSFGRIIAQNGCVTLQCDKASARLVISDDYTEAFVCSRNGTFDFAGEYMNIETTDSYDIKMGISYTKPLVRFRVLPVISGGGSFYIGQALLETEGLYYGQSRIALASELG